MLKVTRLIADRRGVAALEFAIIGPVLFILMLGTMYGRT
jgi:Flp pilus assembly protein TadG